MLLTVNDKGLGWGQVGGYGLYRPIFHRWGVKGVNFLWRNPEKPVFGLNLTKLTLI